MTEQEKQIYNTYLATVRSKQKKPFKIRKDFTNFEKQNCYPYIKRLVGFFNRYPHIKPQDFFAAPYEVHQDQEHISIDYFLTRTAIKAYSLYQKKIQEVSPDSQIEFIRSSLQFIGSFCLKNRIQLHEYLHHRTNYTYTWMMHYREHNISIYSILEIEDISSLIADIPTDERELLVDDLHNTILKFKTRYHNSVATKKLVKEGTEKIKKFLNSSLLNKEQQPQFSVQ